MINKTRHSAIHTDSKLIKEVHNLALSERSLELELAKEIKILSKEIARMKDMEVIQIFKNKWKFIGLSFVKGIAVGFGSVLGATLFISLFVYILGQLSVVPVIGDWVKDVITEVNHTQEVANPKDLFMEKYGEAEKTIRYE